MKNSYCKSQTGIHKLKTLWDMFVMRFITPPTFHPYRQALVSSSSRFLFSLEVVYCWNSRLNRAKMNKADNYHRVLHKKISIKLELSTKYGKKNGPTEHFLHNQHLFAITCTDIIFQKPCWNQLMTFTAWPLRKNTLIPTIYSFLFNDTKNLRGLQHSPEH